MVRLQTEAPELLIADDRVDAQPQRHGLPVARGERHVLRERGDFADAQQHFIAGLGGELLGERLIQHNGVRRDGGERRSLCCELPEVLIHAEDVDAIRATRAVGGVDRAGQCEDRRGIQLRGERRAEEPVASSHCRFDFAQPCQRHVPQAAAHGVAHQQRADEDRRADRRAQQHAEMRPRVEAQAAKGEGPEGHGRLNHRGTEDSEK